MTGAQILTQQAHAKGKAEGEAKGKVEGEAKGKAEGKAEGEAKGKAEIVLKQLTLKFGTLSAEQLARVQSSSIAELERYAERIITVDTLDAVLAR